MGKRNPYRVAEKAMNALGWTFIGLCSALAFVGGAIGLYSQWGWWSLLALPAIIAAFLGLSGLIYLGTAVSIAWNRRKSAWERQNEGN